MKSIFLWILGIIVVIGLATVVLFFLRPHQNTPATSSGNMFPEGGPASSSPSGTSPLTSTGLMSLQVQDGSTIAALDFIHNGVTVEDPVNHGNYYLAGTTSYCSTDGTCLTAASTTAFSILYVSSSQNFVVSLNQEPIGQVRQDAEQFLMKTLDLDQDEMCDLKYSVLVPESINPQYAGQNLGFSFCPGAVTLPQ